LLQAGLGTEVADVDVAGVNVAEGTDVDVAGVNDVNDVAEDTAVDVVFGKYTVINSVVVVQPEL
jgi:hypothetical protein